MKELDSLNLRELTIEEMKATEGGWLGGADIVFGILYTCYEFRI